MEAEKITLIDGAAEIEGKLQGKDARIHGRFRGDIELSGKLYLAEGCKVEAKVKADVIEVAGDYQGDLNARSLILLEKARVVGTITAQSLSVREGAQLNGAVNAGKGVAAYPAPASGVAAG